jgi:hypothetical protein
MIPSPMTPIVFMVGANKAPGAAQPQPKEKNRPGRAALFGLWVPVAELGDAAEADLPSAVCHVIRDKRVGLCDVGPWHM